MRVLPHERRTDPLERLDAALFAALGLVSAMAAFDAVLEDHGRPSALRAPTASPADEGLLMALVGLVALRRRCGAHLEALMADGRAGTGLRAPAIASGPDASAGSPVALPSTRSPESLLR
ncbi:MAG TPA: hypothetical protein VK762_04380 [Polyangiaceae bacterium]|nr:hypothetical protein [Polyangiaceae bacterium]